MTPEQGDGFWEAHQKASREAFGQQSPFVWMEDEEPHFHNLWKLAAFVSLFWVLVGIGTYIVLR